MFRKIRKKLANGEIANMRKIVEAYVDKVEVYPDKIKVCFNFIPGITLDFNEKKECNCMQSSLDSIEFAAENGGEGNGSFFRGKN